MNDIKNWTEILLESYRGLINGFIIALPKIIVGIILFVLGWLLAKFISTVITRSLKALKFDRLMDRLSVGEVFNEANMKSTPSKIVGKLVFWSLLLLMIVGFADALELTVVSQKIGVLINYIPNVILAAVILIVGFYIAGRVKDFIQTSLASYAIRANRLISNILFYIIAGFVVLTALEQLKFNIHLLTSNVMILLGGVALAFALGYGLSAREVFPNIISSYYNKGMFKVGDYIKVGDTEGKILEITNISVVIKTESGKRFIPARKMIVEEVEVIETT